MSRREMLCEGCGLPFLVEVGRPGRQARHCSATCRGRASRERRRLRQLRDLTAKLPELSDRALIGALSALAPTAVATLHRELQRATQAGS